MWHQNHRKALYHLIVFIIKVTHYAACTVGNIRSNIDRILQAASNVFLRCKEPGDIVISPDTYILNTYLLDVLELNINAMISLF